MDKFDLRVRKLEIDGKLAPTLYCTVRYALCTCMYRMLLGWLVSYAPDFPFMGIFKSAHNLALPGSNYRAALTRFLWLGELRSLFQKALKLTGGQHPAAITLQWSISELP